MEGIKQRMRDGAVFDVVTESTALSESPSKSACFAWWKRCCPRMNDCEWRHADPGDAGGAERVHNVTDGCAAARTGLRGVGVLGVAAAGVGERLLDDGGVSASALVLGTLVPGLCYWFLSAAADAAEPGIRVQRLTLLEPR